ncbi:MAG: carboxypeptidase-like regulatory domain-containing protein, partial [Imperialibacter sp.]
SNDVIPGANIYLKGDTIGVVSDMDGKFTFPKPLQRGDVLVFSFIGYDHKEYTVSKDAPAIIDIPMKMCYDIKGEVSINHIYTTKSNPFRSAWQKVASLF